MKRPNFLFIMTDTQATNMVGCYSGKPLNTQNIDSLAAEGIRGFAPIFPDTCYHLTHYWPAAADIPVASDNPTHYADGFHCNARSPRQGYAMPFLHSVSA